MTRISVSTASGKIFFVICFVPFSLVGCVANPAMKSDAPSKTRCKHEIADKHDISRDIKYIHFADCDQPYETEGRVGGEHSNVIKILAFGQETYEIKMTATRGKVECRVNEATGLKISNSSTRDGNSIVVRTGSVDDILIGIEVYAHPDGEYKIKVTKVN